MRFLVGAFSGMSGYLQANPAPLPASQEDELRILLS